MSLPFLDQLAEALGCQPTEAAVLEAVCRLKEAQTPRKDARVLLVTGGRDLCDQGLVFSTLDAEHERYPISLLQHGACPSGADDLAEQWAKAREIDYRGFPARWKRHGKHAGPLRNQRQVKALQGARFQGFRVDAIAFPGGPGTADQVRRLQAGGIETRVIGKPTALTARRDYPWGDT